MRFLAQYLPSRLTIFAMCWISETINATHRYTALFSPGPLFIARIYPEIRFLNLTFLFDRNLAALSVLINRGADVDMKCHGTAPVLLALATAVQPGGENFAMDAMTMLLENNANATVKVRLDVSFRETCN